MFKLPKPSNTDKRNQSIDTKADRFFYNQVDSIQIIAQVIQTSNTDNIDRIVDTEVEGILPTRIQQELTTDLKTRVHNTLEQTYIYYIYTIKVEKEH